MFAKCLSVLNKRIFPVMHQEIINIYSLNLILIQTIFIEDTIKSQSIILHQKNRFHHFVIYLGTTDISKCSILPKYKILKSNFDLTSLIFIKSLLGFIEGEYKNLFEFKNSSF